MVSSNGKADRGDLLLEPPTRYSMIFFQLIDLVLTPIAVAIILILLAWNWSELWNDNVEMVIIGIAIVIALLLNGAFHLYLIGTYRPFRVYSHGFTSPEVPFAYGLRGRDVFVPFDAVERVEKHHLAVSGERGPMLVVTYGDGSGTGRVRIRFMDARESTGKVIDAFEEHVKDRMHEGPLLSDD